MLAMNDSDGPVASCVICCSSTQLVVVAPCQCAVICVECAKNVAVKTCPNCDVMIQRGARGAPVMHALTSVAIS
jgi:hypothetical protein